MLLCSDPKASYVAQKEEIDQAIMEVMASGWYIMGQRLKAFEEKFAAFCECKFCIGVANGSDAVQLALRACGVGPGDSVITVAHTAVATVSAVDWIGARPVLVDIEPETFTISCQAVEATLKRAAGRIKAIIAVHLYGHPADMSTLCRLAAEYRVVLIEDCAQAHGALHYGRKVGCIGQCGAFSFYPTKNLGAFGDGGAVTTQQADVAEQIRLLQQYGWKERYYSDQAGYNSRLDELQASILHCKLRLLDSGNERRREIARRYTEGFTGLPMAPPVERLHCRHVYHQYVIRVKERDALRKHMEARGIKPAILYPMPIHLQRGYASRVSMGEGGMFVTEQTAKEILCLPIFPELPDAAIECVIEAVKTFFFRG
jgi:dTDP-4-amino-4,6-dideoxygalactose transaminase